ASRAPADAWDRRSVTRSTGRRLGLRSDCGTWSCPPQRLTAEVSGRRIKLALKVFGRRSITGSSRPPEIPDEPEPPPLHPPHRAPERPHHRAGAIPRRREHCARGVARLPDLPLTARAAD